MLGTPNIIPIDHNIVPIDHNIIPWVQNCSLTRSGSIVLSDDSILCDNSKQACRFFKNPLTAQAFLESFQDLRLESISQVNLSQEWKSVHFEFQFRFQGSSFPSNIKWSFASSMSSVYFPFPILNWTFDLCWIRQRIYLLSFSRSLRANEASRLWLTKRPHAAWTS